MEVKDMIPYLEKVIESNEEKLEDKKNNISSTYFMAKHDFRVIENIEDSLNTFKEMLAMAQDLQQRIIDRNNKNIDEL